MNNVEIFKGVTDLVTLDKKQVAKIVSRLPEYYRVKSMIGHSTSQSSYSLQTMNMISDSPMSRMKQCMAQIRKKYDALSEAYFKVEEKKLMIKKHEKKENEFSKLEVRKLNSEINNVSVSMENSLREIGLMQNIYDSIKKNNNISDNWSEKDFEKQEIEHMIRSSFRLGIQDITASDRASRAVTEYWEQLGIHPQLGEQRCRVYLLDMQNRINDEKKVSINLMWEFQDKMVKEFGESYKEALKRMGLDELGSEEFMASGQTKPQ